MTATVAWMDQTLSEAVRLQVPPGALRLLVDTLGQFPLSSMDVGVADWCKCERESKANTLPNLRGRIRPGVVEVVVAGREGFTKLIVAYQHRQGVDLARELTDVLRAADKLGLSVSLDVSNASELTLQEISSIAILLNEVAIESLIYRDGGSRLDPFLTYEILSRLQKISSHPLEFHAHNAYGLATANCLAAVQAGIGCVHTAIAGIGPDGHAAYEEVYMAVKKLLCLPSGDTAQLAACSEVLGYMGQCVSATKAVIGRDIFAHESGIHADGVLKQPQLYEPFSPAEVGLSRRVVIGKHSGKAALIAKFANWDIALSLAESQLLLEQVRMLAIAEKSSVSDEQLQQLYVCNIAPDSGSRERMLVYVPS